MTGEEMERAIEFLFKSQAQLSANVDKMSGKVDRTTDSVTALLAIAELQAQEIKELGGSVKDLGESVRAIDDRQRQADDRLNALINVVERLVGGRGGV